MDIDEGQILGQFIYFQYLMGNEESQQKQQQQGQQVSNAKGQSSMSQQQQLQIQQQQDYDGIKAIHPLVMRVLMKEDFPSDIHIDSGNLPLAYQMVQQYFAQINQTIAQNQEQITVQTKRQLKEYIDLSSVLRRRQNDLDGKLASMLSLFRQLHENVTATSKLLNETIERADSLAAKIDPTLSFKEFA